MRDNKARYVFVAFAAVLSASLQANTITVNSLADTAANDGVCTLREAITAANTNTASGAMPAECAAGLGADLIQFSVAGTIQPATVLPSITSVVHINGYTAPGASKNTLPLAQGTNALLKIEIDGVLAGDVSGLALLTNAASGSIIEGLVINNSADPVCCAQNGIYLNLVNGAATTIVRGNFVGTNAAGTVRQPKGSRGIYLDGVANVVIGSDNVGALDPGAMNLISGNTAAGIATSSVTNVRIRGNLVGTNAAGTASLHNAQGGMFFDGTSSSWVGDNVSSGNTGAGIRLRATSSGVDFVRNIIGRNAAGSGAVPNSFSGLFIAENANSTPTTITDVDVVDNLIASNNCASGCGGITIGESNSANTVKGIRLSGNRVFSNEHLEIDLGVTNGTNNGLLYGVTADDLDDPDDGANAFQNFPVVTAAISNAVDVVIDFTLNSEPSKTFTLEFFYTTACDGSGYGGAETFLGGDDFATDASGDLEDEITLPMATTTGFITATATNEDNGTSEFSACVPITQDVIFEDSFENLVP